MPVDVANDLQNALLRKRIFMLISYTNNDGSRLHHRYFRQGYSLEDAIIACETVKEDLIVGLVRAGEPGEEKVNTLDSSMQTFPRDPGKS